MVCTSAKSTIKERHSCAISCKENRLPIRTPHESPSFYVTSHDPRCRDVATAPSRPFAPTARHRWQMFCEWYRTAAVRTLLQTAGAPTPLRSSEPRGRLRPRVNTPRPREGRGAPADAPFRPSGRRSGDHFIGRFVREMGLERGAGSSWRCVRGTGEGLGPAERPVHEGEDAESRVSVFGRGGGNSKLLAFATPLGGRNGRVCRRRCAARTWWRFKRGLRSLTLTQLAHVVVFCFSTAERLFRLDSRTGRVVLIIP